jgi:hypothetical protein
VAAFKPDGGEVIGLKTAGFKQYSVRAFLTIDFYLIAFGALAAKFAALADGVGQLQMRILRSCGKSVKQNWR